ncbi:uncharacterized protein LOC143446327 isoform X2 [Clavelina lepadiformis]|uniref:uncharacterized protein LOC143446327 isoform X2 n=1 Tax=Clavelina lepadiformis TaxID=159417 RepID=UPI0040414234
MSRFFVFNGYKTDGVDSQTIAKMIKFDNFADRLEAYVLRKLTSVQVCQWTDAMENKLPVTLMILRNLLLTGGQFIFLFRKDFTTLFSNIIATFYCVHKHGSCQRIS